jgi:hypothetical protein
VAFFIYAKLLLAELRLHCAAAHKDPFSAAQYFNPGALGYQDSLRVACLACVSFTLSHACVRPRSSLIVCVVRPDYFGYAAAFLFNALLPRKGPTDDQLLSQLSRFVAEVRHYIISLLVTYLHS